MPALVRRRTAAVAVVLAASVLSAGVVPVSLARRPLGPPLAGTPAATRGEVLVSYDRAVTHEQIAAIECGVGGVARGAVAGIADGDQDVQGKPLGEAASRDHPLTTGAGMLSAVMSAPACVSFALAGAMAG